MSYAPRTHGELIGSDPGEVNASHPTTIQEVSADMNMQKSRLSDTSSLLRSIKHNPCPELFDHFFSKQHFSHAIVKREDRGRIIF
jgi:hypothetical protein